MPIVTQAKLLRVLEDSNVRRLGGRVELPVDVRVIAATNRAPGQALANKALREDLYYRLNVFHIPLPPRLVKIFEVPDISAFAMMNNLHEEPQVRATASVCNRAGEPAIAAAE